MLRPGIFTRFFNADALNLGSSGWREFEFMLVPSEGLNWTHSETTLSECEPGQIRFLTVSDSFEGSGTSYQV